MIIIYAKGAYFENRIEYINWDEVVAIADKKAYLGEVYNEIPVVLPAEINKFDYDAVVVFSEKQYEDIKKSIHYEYGVPLCRILSFNEYYGRRRFELKYSNVDRMTCAQIIAQYENGKILDTENSLLADMMFVIPSEVSTIDILKTENDNSKLFFYDRQVSYDKTIDEKYDLSIIWGDDLFKHELLDFCLDNSKDVLYIQDRIGEDICRAFHKRADVFDDAKLLKGHSHNFWLIHSKVNNTDNSSKMYVVVHKNFIVPSDDFYTPICVGGYRIDDKSITDDTGDNVACFNGKINELTALYWIWKHSKADNIGMCHYRRMFANNNLCFADDKISRIHADELLKRYDILLAKEERFEREPVGKQIQNFIDPEAYNYGYKCVRTVLERNQPEYVEAFDLVWSRYSFFPCNMFYTKKEILDKYCSWLFSFIIEAAELADVSYFNVHDQRIIGFIAERMITVWLTKERYKIKEMEIISVL